MRSLLSNAFLSFGITEPNSCQFENIAPLAFIDSLATLHYDTCTRLVLSQVPPAEVLIIGCDRHPGVPVIVENYTTKGG